MLCSVQTSKSGSNWLDRLWSNKGFNNNKDDDPSLPNPSSSPITNASNSVINSNSGSTHSGSDQNKVTTAAAAAATTREVSSSDNKDLFYLMNNVLADLFNMGGGSDPVEESSRLSRKKEKIPRKQTKPKFCFISGNNSNNDSLGCVRKDQHVLAAAGSLSSDKNSNNVDCGVDDDEEEEDVEEEKEKEKGLGVSGDKELKGYSRSEVTVIDTSCQVWKFDKLVFRKKNVWKVRDKKGKSWVFGCKKRKGNDLESANGNGAKKKAKVSNLEVGSSKDANDVQKPEDEKREEVHNEMPEDLSQVPKKRIHFSRSPDKSNKSGSSVVLIKAIPTSNKSGRNVTKNRLKDNQMKNKT